MVVQRSVCCYFLTQGCETCQHQKPEHVCSTSESFYKEWMLHSFFYISTQPLLVWKSVAVFLLLWQKSSVHLWFVSHSVISQFPHTSCFDQWKNGPQWRMTHRLTSLSLDDWKSQWLIGVLIYLSCWINSTASLLGIFFLENVAGWPNFCLTLWGLSNHPQLQKQFIGPLT